jgi:hypothetical protein
MTDPQHNHYPNEGYRMDCPRCILNAASPKLLDALKALVAADNCNYMTETMRYEGLFDKAREAIQEATGEKL